MLRKILILGLLAGSMTVVPSALAVPTCANPLVLNGIADGGLDSVGFGDTQYWYVLDASNVVVQVWNTVPVFVEAYSDGTCSTAVACTDLSGAGLTWVCPPLFANQKLSVTGAAAFWSQYAISSVG